MEYSDFKNFADLMSYYRALANMKQDELAKKTNLSRVTISNVENGKRAALVTKVKIMKALNVPSNIIQAYVRCD